VSDIKGVSFDLSKTRTGVCLWTNREPVRVVSWEFTGDHDVGSLLASFRNRLATAIPANPEAVAWVAFEDVRPVNKHHSEIHFGLTGVLAEICFRRNVPLLRATASAVKKALAGSGRATKDEMLAAARERYPGVNVRNHDEADALGVGLVAVGMIDFEGSEDLREATRPSPF
jgi:Holliday junction resolvasome RuvABC endonuclease subunit